ALGRDERRGSGPRAAARAAWHDLAAADGGCRDSPSPPAHRIRPCTEVFHERSSTDELEVSSEARRGVGAQRSAVSSARVLLPAFRCLPLRACATGRLTWRLSDRPESDFPVQVTSVAGPPL